MSPLPSPEPIEFHVQHGRHRVRCAVSAEALDIVCGHVEPANGTSRRRAFERFRTLINAAAMRKLEGTIPGAGSVLTLDGDDLRAVPHVAGTPVFGTDGLRPK